MSTNKQNNNQGQASSWTPAMFQTHGLPAPAGTNENGEPYWIINDQEVSWEQMQQYIWQARQQAQASAGGGRGFEQMPAMPMPNFEAPVAPETNVEKGPQSPEKSPERTAEQAVEQAAESGGRQQQAQTKPEPVEEKEEEVEPPFSDSAPLKTKLTVQNMVQFTKTNKSTDPADSNAYIRALFVKNLQRILAGIGV